MKMRILVAASLATVLSASTALADNVTGLGLFSYQHNRGDVNSFKFGGTANYEFEAPGLNLQFTAGDNHLDATGVDADFTTIKGDAFWRSAEGVFGGTVAHHILSAGASFGGFSAAGSASTTSFGAFGEYFAAPEMTLSLKGGGFAGDFDGGYVGVGGKYYVLPNLSFGTDYNYVKPDLTKGIHQINVDAEFMPFESTPFSVGLGYTYLETAGLSSNAVSFSLKYRFGTASGSSLSAWDRSGPTQWTGQLPIVGDLR
jgi:hypothetical protein